MQQNEFTAAFQNSQGQSEEKVKFILEQAMKAQSGSRAIVYSFFNLSARLGWVVNTMPWPLYPLAKGPVPTVQEGGRASLDGCRKCHHHHHQDSIPGPSSP
jgi:hypothetical protein